MSAELPDVEMLLGPAAIPLGRYTHACSYLPFRNAAQESWLVWRMQPDVYQALMDRGLRRSGHLIYQNTCSHCAMCMPIRIPVRGFEPSKSQRRTLRRNRDVQVSIDTPQLTREKHELYRRYLRSQQKGSNQSSDIDSLREFLYSSCVPTLELEYRDPRGRLLAVSICDVGKRFLSSVYHYFDPTEARRRLGVFSVLHEIELCRERRIPHYYLGYWIKGCRTMKYKADYRPHELMVDGQWVPGDQA
jgi:leucyl-tRNA---protein transferase